MLRLVFQWFAESGARNHELSFAPGAHWFSEARLASAFLPRNRGDKFAEGYTHADGVIGHLRIGEATRAELKLEDNADQFVVVEAKMFSALSKGTTHAPKYNQAARNVACMAHIIENSRRSPSQVANKAFYVLAPKEQLKAGVFSEFVQKSSIERVVAARAANYDPPRTEWFETCFMPTLESMHIDCLAWEDVIAEIKTADSSFGSDLEIFYDRCVEFNRPLKGAKIG